jgi:hypothetical protein
MVHFGLGRAAWLLLIVLIVSAPGPARADLVTLRGNLDAAQVVDAGESNSQATGLASLSIDTAAQSITLDFSWTGLTGPADRAHLHDAPAGVSRLDYDPFDAFFDEVFEFDNPLRTIDCSSWHAGYHCVPETGSLHFEQTFADMLQYCPPGNPTLDCTVDAMGDFLVRAARNDVIYLDMHTEQYRSGEIRGQLLLVPEPAMAWLLAWPLTFLACRTRGQYARSR